MPLDDVVIRSSLLGEPLKHLLFQSKHFNSSQSRLTQNSLVILNTFLSPPRSTTDPNDPALGDLNTAIRLSEPLLAAFGYVDGDQAKNYPDLISFIRNPDQNVLIRSIMPVLNNLMKLLETFIKSLVALNSNEFEYKAELNDSILRLQSIRTSLYDTKYNLTLLQNEAS
jgi:hypothetical protein